MKKISKKTSKVLNVVSIVLELAFEIILLPLISSKRLQTF